MRLLSYGTRGVDIKLVSFSEPGPDVVFWSVNAHSYVCVASEHGLFRTAQDEPCRLCCINSIGEIRWEVLGHPDYWSEEEEAAIAHFRLRIE